MCKRHSAAVAQLGQKEAPQLPDALLTGEPPKTSFLFSILWTCKMSELDGALENSNLNYSFYI